MECFINKRTSNLEGSENLILREIQILFLRNDKQNAISGWQLTVETVGCHVRVSRHVNRGALTHTNHKHFKIGAERSLFKFSLRTVGIERFFIQTNQVFSPPGRWQRGKSAKTLRHSRRNLSLGGLRHVCCPFWVDWRVFTFGVSRRGATVQCGLRFGNVACAERWLVRWGARGEAHARAPARSRAELAAGIDPRSAPAPPPRRARPNRGAPWGGGQYCYSHSTGTRHLSRVKLQNSASHSYAFF